MRTTLRAAALVLATMLMPLRAQESLPLVRAIELPRVQGRIDHLAADVGRQRLYLAALDNNTVEVLDLAAGKHLKSIPGFHHPQGIAVVSDPPLFVVANGGTGDVVWLDGSDQHVVRTIALGDDADNVRFDAAANRVLVGYGEGAIGALDARDGRRLGDVALSGHPESFQVERAGRRVFVNVPSAGHIAVVDRGAMKVLTAWPVTEALAHYPMALDEAAHRLFVGCRRPAKVLVYDIASGKQVGSADSVGDADDLFYDSARERLYVIGGEGFVDVLARRNGSAFSRTARVATSPGARTGLYVPERHRLYVAVPRRGTQRAEVREYDTAEDRR